MSLPWFAFNIKDFLANTKRLNTEAKGAYLCLMLDYYEHEKGPPDDDDVLAAICELPVETWRRHRRVIEPLFDVTDSVWHHRRIDDELRDGLRRHARTVAATAAAKAAREAKKTVTEPSRTPLRSKPSVAETVTPTVTDIVTDDVTSLQTQTQSKKEALPSVALRADGSTRSEPALKIKVAPRLVLDSNADETKPKKRPRALPPDWKPSARSYVLAEQFGQNVQIVEGIFRDYCASSGKLYADHDAAFHNFIRNQSNFHRGSGNGIRQNEAAGRGSIVNAADRAIQNLEREIAADNEAREGVVLSLPSQRL